ncbi:MAG: AGE family epimerase/isomerase [Clostridia bacterium]|nr:AGE family epimerase/isomerase [Clostridia bacterium]
MDNENGGIFTCLDKDGNIYGTDKSVWFQGRALWVFSKVHTQMKIASLGNDAGIIGAALLWKDNIS